MSRCFSSLAHSTQLSNEQEYVARKTPQTSIQYRDRKGRLQTAEPANQQARCHPIKDEMPSINWKNTDPMRPHRCICDTGQLPDTRDDGVTRRGKTAEETYSVENSPGVGGSLWLVSALSTASSSSEGSWLSFSRCRLATCSSTESSSRLGSTARSSGTVICAWGAMPGVGMPRPGCGWPWGAESPCAAAGIF